MRRFRSLADAKTLLQLIAALAVGVSAISAKAEEPSSAFPPPFASVKADFEPSERVLLDRKSEPLDELRTNPVVRRLAWTELRELSPAMRDALLRSEDKRFYEHAGVDWIALGAAVLRLPFSKSSRGASTISMQLTKFLDERGVKSGRRSITEKLDQIRAALQLEKTWKKDEILEAYLNLVSFRGEMQGLRAAARGLFGKDPHGLNQEESALLSVLIRSPNASADKVAARACILLKQLKEDSEETELDALDRFCPGLSQRVSALFAKPYEIAPQERLAPVLASRLLPVQASDTKSAAHKKIARELKTTIDARLQRLALQSLRQQLAILKPQNVRDGAVLVLDNQSGDVLAYVANGGSGLSSAWYIDGIQAKRQAGSTLKPFLYARAMERKILTPASWLEDSPSDFDAGPSGVYRPRNYDNQFHGLVSARDALGSSLNVPAVRTLLLIGESTAIETLRSLGIKDLKDSGTYGPSLALGTVDVSLWELTNAYRTFARGGVYSLARVTHETNAPWPVSEGANGQRIFKNSTAFLIGDILSDREARRLAFGLESPLATRFWTAVKTGTSKDMRDNWCVGYSDRYTVGVWVGNFAGQSMWNVSGVSGAAPVWLEVMQALGEGGRSDLRASRKVPKDVVSASYSFKSPSGETISKRDFFLSGTEPRDAMQTAPGRPAIAYPGDGLLIAIDPDIPFSQQRVPFEAKNATGSMMFFLNGKPVASAKETALWRPEPGHQLLELKSSDGRVVDQVKFEVR